MLTLQHNPDTPELLCVPVRVDPAGDAMPLPVDAVAKGPIAVLTYRLRASTGYEVEGTREGLSPEHWQAIATAIEHPPTEPNAKSHSARVADGEQTLRGLFERAFQKIFHAYATPADKYPTDAAWAAALRKQVTSAHTDLQALCVMLDAGDFEHTFQLNANQIAAALDFVAPDYGNDPEQGLTEVVIARYPAGTFSDGSPREAGLYCFLVEDPGEGSLLLDPSPAHFGIAHCIGCGCDDLHACPDRCWWLRVDYPAGVGVCSNCEDHVARWDAGDRTHAVQPVAQPSIEQKDDGAA